MRPEAAGLLREIPQSQLPPLPILPFSEHKTNSCDKEIASKNSNKHIAGTKKITRPTSGIDYYQHRLSTEWAPIQDRNMGKQPMEPQRHFETYLSDQGMMPGYAGHVPGLQFQ